MNLEHLENFKTYAHGPIQQDEALFLYAVCKMIRPRVVLEFGIQDGLSTHNFALAKDPECLLFSFDIDPQCVRKGIEKLHGIPNCILRAKDCRDFVPEDVQNLPVDICFVDCAHKLATNQVCIRRVMPCMSSTGIFAIHDTGTWTKKAFDAAPEDYKQKTKAGIRLTREFNQNPAARIPAVPQEQMTANWLVTEFPEYNSIHFHSENYFRHGITLLQKKRML